MPHVTKATAHAEGAAAFDAHRSLSANPYTVGTPPHRAWSAGWYSAAKGALWPFPIPKEKLK